MELESGGDTSQGPVILAPSTPDLRRHGTSQQSVSGMCSPECEATMPLPNLLNCLWLQGEDTCFKVVTLGSQFQEKRQTSRSITGTTKAKESGKDLSHVTLVTYFCSLLFFFFLHSVNWPFNFKWAGRPSDVLNLFIIKHNQFSQFCTISPINVLPPGKKG